MEGCDGCEKIVVHVVTRCVGGMQSCDGVQRLGAVRGLPIRCCGRAKGRGASGVSVGNA